LLLHGKGLDSEDRAAAAARQCSAAGIDTRERSIDDVGLNLAPYTGLLAFLPTISSGANIIPVLRSFAQLVADYRLHRPRGLADVRAGRIAWFDAGVVQMFGDRALLDHPALRAAHQQICIGYELDDDAAVDVLRAYQPDAPLLVGLGPREAGDVLGETIKVVWARVNEWGIHDPASVDRLMLCLRACQQTYEDPRYSQLYRPFAGIGRNRLTIILEGPDLKIDKRQEKTWQENGARICREVEKRLQVVVPTIRCPRSRGKQRALRQLYQDLRTLVDIAADDSATSHPFMVR
jgi:hypothetical protein